ncbi:hypothetical protein OAF06_00575 [Akkermansiaceae bacterium]|nr:hypothetical protein [bacterium]MDB4626834.1 hypothetical protein [Akkermansiaceae bacterium]MDB4667255.1 hypothetical protein [Akkermansiaceae bacterium]MDB4796205.1 hypothetical protein [Akkermansiaceae bacterium]MDC0274643.1 hypothetical protein [Akkermansiaceae bacterium]
MLKGKILRNTVAAVGLALASASLAFGQEEIKLSKDNKFSVSSPDFIDLPSPSIDTGVSKRFKPKDWLEIEVKFKVQKLKTRPKDEYLDSVKVKWWVVVKGQDRKTYLMEKEVNHVNIPVDEEVVASIYLSPNALRRITGSSSASKSDLEAVGGEIHFSGEMVGFFSHGKRDGWWRKDLGSVERTKKFPLLDKNETPFKFLWYDRYAEIAPKD